MALGIDSFSGTVGGNVSGTSDLAPLTEQADMILELLPETKTVGLLYCSAEPNSEYQVQVVEEYLTGKGITCPGGLRGHGIKFRQEGLVYPHDTAIERAARRSGPGTDLGRDGHRRIHYL